MTWSALGYECELAVGMPPQWEVHMDAVFWCKARQPSAYAGREGYYKARLAKLLADPLTAAKLKATNRRAHERFVAKKKAAR